MDCAGGKQRHRDGPTQDEHKAGDGTDFIFYGFAGGVGRNYERRQREHADDDRNRGDDGKSETLETKGRRHGIKKPNVSRVSAAGL
jgi:hypothetical protein